MVRMPKGTRLFPSILREAGYYCTNHSKEDYNVASDEKVWDQSNNKAHWRGREKNQPFFAVFNSTLSHESAIRNYRGEIKTDPSKVRLPAYHPDTPVVRRDWAIYYDTVSAADEQAGVRLREIEEAGLSEQTIVFYWGDHGSGMPRSKRWPGNSGLHVPLVVYIPEAYQHLRPEEYLPGGVSERMVAFIDFAPTVLSLAGITPPSWMQGSAFLGQHQGPAAQYLYGFRGRMDERLDLVRSVSDGRFVYLRNYMLHRSTGQHLDYQLQTPTTREWLKMFNSGALNTIQAAFWKTPKDSEELYDLTSDPDEVMNLAESHEYQSKLMELRMALHSHLLATGDLGVAPEGVRAVNAGQLAQYDWRQQQPESRMSRWWGVAELVSGSAPISAEDLLMLMKDQDEVVRYWGLMGVRRLQADGIDVVQPKSAVREELVQMMHDPEAIVRVTAAECLVVANDGGRDEAAIELLLDHAELGKQNVFTAMAAIEAMSFVDRDSLLARVDRLRALPINGALLHQRYDIGVPRLLAALGEQLGIELGSLK
jgi:arylsulfatase A-like enzyme